MDDASIEQIVNELRALLVGRAPGKIFQFGATALAIDFGLRREGYLFISVDPALPRFYLIQRRVRDIERQGTPLNQFGLSLRKEFSGTRLISITKHAGDRIVRFQFEGEDELGKAKQPALIAQLTGRSANLLLLDRAETILAAARATDIPGQRLGDPYVAPRLQATSASKTTDLLNEIRGNQFPSASTAADAFYTNLIATREAKARAKAAQAHLRKQIAQQQRLQKQLQSDLRSHADAEQHKKIGDLLLANLSSAKRTRKGVSLTDYFADGAPSIQIEIDQETSLQEEAQRRFAAYQRSKRARAQIRSRLTEVEQRLRQLESEVAQLTDELPVKPAGSTAADRAITPLGSTKSSATASGHAHPKTIPGTRRYFSSDEYEILVGRTSSDNDHLTFKIAKPNDLWLHAADYGGSHVVVRNSTRKDVPHRTLIEAAQLAAYFSQAKKDPKVDVHYTQRKFVSKPKGAKPGLVRLLRFKNITVQPKEAGTRI